MSSRGYKAWLGADRLAEERLPQGLRLERAACQKEGGEVLRTAVEELLNGLEALTGLRPVIVDSLESENDAVSQADEREAGDRTGLDALNEREAGERAGLDALNEREAGDRAGLRSVAVGVIGKLPSVDAAVSAPEAAALAEEGFIIREVADTANIGTAYVAIAGKTERGLLHGVFYFLRLLGTGGLNESQRFDYTENPAFSLRMINQWDNMDGSVERGYSGRSIFYEGYEVLADSPRIRDYARLLASVGINGIAINNVNVHLEETKLITERYLPDVAKVATVFRAFGIKLYLSVNFAGPVELGELATADPLDADVQAWWRERASEVYGRIPDFGGFLVKADSENRPGPFTYGRDHADGANMLADVLAPYGGIVLWRCFVYNCHQDWRDRMTDRARAAYDHFRPLDGKFRDNVILQVKNGPMDFQVREPVSPLFGAMPHTNQMMEFQIAQEYTGQQRDVCFLVPQWKEVLGFDTRLKGEGTTVRQIAEGRVHPFSYSGVTAVSNIGDDDNWTGHHLAQANLYGYGRLMWNPDLSSETIATEWTRLTFGEATGAGGVAEAAVVGWLLSSWRTYENYTAPLGVGWMVRPHYHYGPDVDGYEYSKWGTYHFADHRGIGVDRTCRTGTGYTGQYEDANAARYESLDHCPDELLLFFHHVPYTHALHDGRTVIQHIYDTHFDGAAQAEAALEAWLALEGKIDEERFRHVAGRAGDQIQNARLWRDVINTYFYRKSGIPDERGRTIY